MEAKCNILQFSNIISEIENRSCLISRGMLDIYLKYTVVDWFLNEDIPLKISIDSPDSLKEDRESVSDIISNLEEISEDGFIRILDGETPYLVFESIEMMNIFLLTWR